VFGPIDGSHLSEPFTTTISFTAPQVTETGLPNASATILPAGSPATATITVTNTSSVRKFYFADPRLNTVATQLLAPFGQVNGVPLPLSLTSQPVWLVPTHSQNLTVAAQGTIPITMDVTASNGDPDVLAAATGTNAVAATRSDPELAPGFWFGLPEPMGPFGVTGVTGSVDLGATALTNRFDPAVASSAGDIWLAALNPATPSSPLVLDPGQSGQITVTITPAGSAGTHVTGFVDVDTFNIDTISGDQVISFPYEYTVG
jgi:hypothetical protein